MGFWLSPAVLIRGAIISLRALARQAESYSSRANTGRGQILRELTKTQCYNLFITYSTPQFELFSLTNHHFSNQEKDNRPCKARNVTQYH